MSHDHDHADGEPCSCGCDAFGGNTYNVHLKAAEVRHVDYLGRDHIVVPVIMARADVVMNGSRVPVDELFPEAWNGVPVTVGHPHVGEGFHTANDPDIMTNWAVGSIFNSHMDGHILKAEAWIDVERADRVRPGLVAQLEQGTEMDVSTGYFSMKEKSAGSLNGRRYTMVDRQINPDHLALLPDEMGACSWDDGCGVRTNKEQGMGDTLVDKIKELIASAKKTPGKPYGSVPYADPGYQADKKHRYPIDTEEHIRAAWSYINQEASAKPYSADQLTKVKDKIVAAWKDKIDKKGPPAANANADASENARGAADDPTQICADLMSSDEAPFTPEDVYGLQNLSQDTLVNLRDMYLGDPDGDNDLSTNNQKEPIVGEKEDKEAVANAAAAKLPATVGELNTLIANAVASALPGALTAAMAPITATLQANALSADDRTALATAAKITADHKAELVTKITTNTTISKEAAEAMPLATLEVVANGIKVVEPDYSARSFGTQRLQPAVGADGKPVVDKAVVAMVPPTTRAAIMNARKEKAN